jgi:hypothetical protein
MTPESLALKEATAPSQARVSQPQATASQNRAEAAPVLPQEDLAQAEQAVALQQGVAQVAENVVSQDLLEASEAVAAEDMAQAEEIAHGGVPFLEEDSDTTSVEAGDVFASAPEEEEVIEAVVEDAEPQPVVLTTTFAPGDEAYFQLLLTGKNFLALHHKNPEELIFPYFAKMIATRKASLDLSHKGRHHGLCICTTASEAARYHDAFVARQGHDLVAGLLTKTTVHDLVDETSLKCDIVFTSLPELREQVRKRTMVLKPFSFVTFVQADAMMGNHFDDLAFIAQRLQGRSQKLVFASKDSPGLTDYVDTYIEKAEVIDFSQRKVTHSKDVRQLALICRAEDKFKILLSLLKADKPARAVVFCNGRLTPQWLEEKLKGNGYQVVTTVINHGGSAAKPMIQVTSDRALSEMQRATGVTHVYNFDLPISGEVYIDRLSFVSELTHPEACMTSFICEEYADYYPRIEEYLVCKAPKPVWHDPELLNIEDAAKNVVIDLFQDRPGRFQRGADRGDRGGRDRGGDRSDRTPREGGRDSERPRRDRDDSRQEGQETRKDRPRYEGSERQDRPRFEGSDRPERSERQGQDRPERSSPERRPFVAAAATEEGAREERAPRWERDRPNAEASSPKPERSFERNSQQRSDRPERDRSSERGEGRGQDRSDRGQQDRSERTRTEASAPRNAAESQSRHSEGQQRADSRNGGPTHRNMIDRRREMSRVRTPMSGSFNEAGKPVRPQGEAYRPNAVPPKKDDQPAASSKKQKEKGFVSKLLGSLFGSKD